MKNECNIIKDLLPLYNENLISEDTKIFVDAHLADCDECRAALAGMEETPELSGKLGIAPLQNLRKKLNKKRIATIVFTSAIVLAVVVSGFAFLTAPQYLPDTGEVFTLTDSESEIAVYSFSGEVTGYDVDSYLSSDGETTVYCLSAWNTAWDKLFNRLFNKSGPQNVVFEPDDGKPFAVLYSPNNDSEAVSFYGSESYTASLVVLPRLFLGYYLALAVIVFIVSAALLFMLRKNPAAKIRTERALLFPVSYVISHIITKGFSTATYSPMRDFSIILFVSILIYLACLLGMYLCRERKENRKRSL